MTAPSAPPPPLLLLLPPGHPFRLISALLHVRRHSVLNLFPAPLATNRKLDSAAAPRWNSQLVHVERTPMTPTTRTTTITKKRDEDDPGLL